MLPMRGMSPRIHTSIRSKARWRTQSRCRGREPRAVLGEGVRIRLPSTLIPHSTIPAQFFATTLQPRNPVVFRESAIKGFKAADYETVQVFYTSKDGTRVPMFLVFKRGLKLDGNNPTLLYGYGGFNITVPPEFNPLRLALLEQGFVYASANLRGGGEYGETVAPGGDEAAKAECL